MKCAETVSLATVSLDVNINPNYDTSSALVEAKPDGFTSRYAYFYD